MQDSHAPCRAIVLQGVYQGEQKAIHQKAEAEESEREGGDNARLCKRASGERDSRKSQSCAI
jgi:hypothetical protein